MLIQRLLRHTESQWMGGRNVLCSLKVRHTTVAYMNLQTLRLWEMQDQREFLLGKTSEHIIKYASAAVLSLDAPTSSGQSEAEGSPAHASAYCAFVSQSPLLGPSSFQSRACRLEEHASEMQRAFGAVPCLVHADWIWLLDFLSHICLLVALLRFLPFFAKVNHQGQKSHIQFHAHHR